MDLAWGMVLNLFGRGMLQLVQLELVRVVGRFEVASDEALWGDKRLARVSLSTISSGACWTGRKDSVRGNS